MPKVLCLFALIVSAILFLLFLVDVLVGVPFARASMLMDVGFLVTSGIVLFFSYLTFRELR